jgi:hypothetical protein
MAGSFVTSKSRPSDFDGCWVPGGVDWARLDPPLRSFKQRRAAQKAWCGGELFPADFPADASMQTYFVFLQKDKNGNPKGIVAIDPGTS